MNARRGRGGSTIFGAEIMVFVHKIEATGSGGEPVAASKITKGDKTKSGGGISPRGVIKH